MMIDSQAEREPLPSLFLSHGAPNMALYESDVREFMRNLSARYPKPSAIVMCSAHFEARGPAVVTDPNPGMIYDFRGFEEALYKVVYPAPGEPNLAEEVARLIEASEDMRLKAVSRIAERGYDHGTWVPLSLAYPDADVPVVQISIDPEQGPEYHYALGAALAPLRHRNILVMASGQLTHNLRAIFSFGRDEGRDLETRTHVEAFMGWIEAQLAARETEKLLNYRAEAPYAVENHPTDDHLLPLYVALGAAGEDYEVRKLHDSVTMGVMAMDAYEFHAL